MCGDLVYWIGAIILGIFWFTSGSFARNNAIHKYKEILIELAETEDNKEKKELMLKEISKSNSEILHEKL